MNYTPYSDIDFSRSYDVFRFVSKGQKGEITKFVSFDQVEDDVYQLGFGDLMADNSINDTVISDNGDIRKVIATIVRIIIAYTSRYPERMIYFYGSTAERNLLYTRAISLNLNFLSVNFDIWGFSENDVKEVFDRTGNYTSFLVKRK